MPSRSRLMTTYLSAVIVDPSYFLALESPYFGNSWTKHLRAIQYDIPKRKTQNTLNFEEITKKKDIRSPLTEKEAISQYCTEVVLSNHFLFFIKDLNV